VNEPSAYAFADSGAGVCNLTLVPLPHQKIHARYFHEGLVLDTEEALEGFVPCGLPHSVGKVGRLERIIRPA
jgi:hypothetical protein